MFLSRLQTFFYFGDKKRVSNGCILCFITLLHLCLCVSQYMEKSSDGRTVVRSEAAECRAARKHELHRQRHVETLLAKLQQEVEKESTGIVYCLLFFFCLRKRKSSLAVFCINITHSRLCSASLILHSEMVPPWPRTLLLFFFLGLLLSEMRSSTKAFLFHNRLASDFAYRLGSDNIILNRTVIDFQVKSQ